MLDLYTWNTHSGRIARITIEESGLPHNLHPVNVGAGANREAGYAAMSGHRRIPMLVDSDGPDGEPITLIESAVIQVYLAKKSGSAMYPTEPREQLQVDQWLLHGQATFAPGMSPIRNLMVNIAGDNETAKDFFRKRAERLYETLDLRLDGRTHIALDRYTIADIAHFTTVYDHAAQSIDLAAYPNVARWYEIVLARPAVQRGLERVG